MTPIAMLLITILMLIVVIYIIYKNRPVRIKPILLIEIIVITISVFFGSIIYSQVKKQIYSTYISYADRAIEALTQPKEEGYYPFFQANLRFTSGITKAEECQYIGFGIEEYTPDHQLITKTNIKGYNIYFALRNENFQLINLEDYFSEEEINGLIAWCEKLNESNGYEYYSGIQPIKIKGYKQEGKFIPISITFLYSIVYEDSDTYVLTHQGITNNNQELIEYTDQNAIILCRLLDSSEEVQAKITSVLNYIVVNDEGVSYTTNGEDILDEVCYLYGTTYINNGENYLKFAFYANTSKLTLISYSFQNTICLAVFFIQNLGMIIYIFYLLYRKKKEALELTRNTLINAMAHEMKTPASIIINSAELIQENIQPDKQAYYLKNIQDEANHLNDLLVEMLTYTRTAEYYKINKTEILLKDLVEKVVNRNNLENIQLEINIDSNTKVLADKALLEKLIDNLLSNAIRYNEGIIQISYSNNKLSIYNNGPKIPEESIKQIWDPFYKVDNARSDTNHTGIGLSIVKNICLLHHFKYGIEQDAHGVSFYIIIK